MNIFELDHHNLQESARFKDRLSPTIWNGHEKLTNGVRDIIMVGLEDYCQALGITESQIRDVLVAGKMAGYDYAKNDTIDVVVVADLNPDPTFRELFNESRYAYNGQQRVMVGDQFVKFYVQPSDEKLVSRGAYSVLRESWVQVPVRRQLEAGDTVTVLKESEQKAQPRVQVVKKKKVVEAQKPTVYGFGKEIVNEVGLTPDGVSQFTKMFLSEEPQDPEEILGDFIDFCSRALELSNTPNFKIKRDPQWSTRNKTFGRFNEQTGILEVSIANRHIMDVLRTVAHELTHQRQAELSQMPDGAGDTGSDHENEANAIAGILMREYGGAHPELFAGEEQIDESVENPWRDIGFDTRSDILWPAKMFETAYPKQSKEFSKLIDEYQQNLPIPSKGDKCILTMVQRLDGLIVVYYGEAEYIDENHTHYILKNSTGINQYAKNNQLVFKTQNELDKFIMFLKLKFGENDFQIEKKSVMEATGYIPTKKQAKDPRYAMALTVDIKPGAIGKNANKLMLNTDAQGHPQVANTNGTVERMREELELFKKK